MGKQMALARKAEEEQALKRNMQVRQAEKEEERRAMAAVKAKIGERCAVGRSKCAVTGLSSTTYAMLLLWGATDVCFQTLKR
jgi:hypothetical protein